MTSRIHSGEDQDSRIAASRIEAGEVAVSLSHLGAPEGEAPYELFWVDEEARLAVFGHPSRSSPARILFERHTRSELAIFRVHAEKQVLRAEKEVLRRVAGRTPRESPD
jgi:hypothetical protein